MTIQLEGRAGGFRAEVFGQMALRACGLVCLVLLATAVNLALFERAASAGEAAATLAKAEAYLDDLGNRTVSLLSDDLKSEAEKKKEVESLLDAEVDFVLVSKYVLGQYWKRVPRRQQPEYHELFRNLEIDTLSRRLLKHPVKGFEITRAKRQGRDDILIDTTIYRSDAENFLPAWRLRKSKDGFKIIDVHYEGVSLAKTRRNEFAGILKDQGFEGLLAQLRQKAAQSKLQ